MVGRKVTVWRATGQVSRRTVSAIALGLLFISTGAMHFRDPDSYVRIMPPYLPRHLELVYLSGIAEIAGGIGVLVRRTRRIAGLGLIALLVAVFPANVHMALYDLPFGRWDPPRAVHWLRLPLQVVLIAWVWWSTREVPIRRAVDE